MDRTIDLIKDFIHFAELYVCFLKNFPLALKKLFVHRWRCTKTCLFCVTVKSNEFHLTLIKKYINKQLRSCNYLTVKSKTAASQTLKWFERFMTFIVNKKYCQYMPEFIFRQLIIRSLISSLISNFMRDLR